MSTVYGLERRDNVRRKDLIGRRILSYAQKSQVSEALGEESCYLIGIPV